MSPLGVGATDPANPTGDVSIGIKCAPGVVGPLEADIDFDIIKNDNDTFTVKYTAPGAGLYTIMVLFANQVRVLGLPHIPEGPSPTPWGAPRGQVGLELRPCGATVSLCPGFGSQEIPSSPFRIKVDPSHDATKVKAEGPGLSRTGEGPGAVGWGGGRGVGVMGAVRQVL